MEARVRNIIQRGTQGHAVQELNEDWDSRIIWYVSMGTDRASPYVLLDSENLLGVSFIAGGLMKEPLCVEQQGRTDDDWFSEIEPALTSWLAEELKEW